MECGAHPLLDEQWDVLDDDRVRSGSGGQRAGAIPDRRVEDRLQVATSGVVAEDDGSEGGPVEAAVGGEDPVAEAGADAVEGGFAGGDDLAGEDVGVDEGRPELGEATGDRRLAGADAPGEAHFEHEPTLPTRSPSDLVALTCPPVREMHGHDRRRRAQVGISLR